MDADLKLIAESRVESPLNEWPEHNDYHSRTIMGNWLFDYACLRCWLERVATEKLKEKQKNDKT
jgi:hypothetical protein